MAVQLEAFLTHLIETTQTHCALCDMGLGMEHIQGGHAMAGLTGLRIETYYDVDVRMGQAPSGRWVVSAQDFCRVLGYKNESTPKDVMKYWPESLKPHVERSGNGPHAPIYWTLQGAYEVASHRKGARGQEAYEWLRDRLIALGAGVGGYCQWCAFQRPATWLCVGCGLPICETCRSHSDRCAECRWADSAEPTEEQA